MIEAQSQIVILGKDSALSHSQKSFIEAAGIPVEIIDYTERRQSTGLRTRDIVIINISIEHLDHFTVLGHLLRLETRPKIIVVISEFSAFDVGDQLDGGPSIVLKNPQSPSEIVEAITSLSIIDPR